MQFQNRRFLEGPVQVPPDSYPVLDHDELLLRYSNIQLRVKVDNSITTKQTLKMSQSNVMNLTMKTKGGGKFSIETNSMLKIPSPKQRDFLKDIGIHVIHTVLLMKAIID